MMNENPILKIKNKEVEIRRHPENPELFNLNDLHKASGLTGNIKDLARHLSEKAVCRFDIVHVNGGKLKGTWANKKGAYWFAAKVDEDFEDAVFEAFDLLTEGNILEAGNVATMFAITPELKQKDKDSEARMTSLIKKVYAPFDKYRYKHYADMANRTATGYCSKELTAGRMSATKYIQNQEHGPAMLARIAARELICRHLEYLVSNPDSKIELDYQYIKQMVEG